MAYTVIIKLGEQFNIRMLAHLSDLLMWNFGHVTLKRP